MTYLLLLVDGEGVATTSRLSIRELREFPGDQGLSVHFRPVRKDLLFESAKSAGRIAYRVLSGEGLVRGQLWVEYEIEGPHVNVTGRSSDLLFALALITSRWKRQSGDYPAIAATGVLDADSGMTADPSGGVQSVRYTAQKVAAAVSALANEVAAAVFYPAADEPGVAEWRLANHVPEHIELHGVSSLDDALGRLGITLEKVYLGNPFRGLEPFDYEHRSIFFGRDAEIRDAVRQLLRREASGVPGLLVEGASGSGKSSFLRAGVLAALINPATQPRDVEEALRKRPVSGSASRAIWRIGLLPAAAVESALARSIGSCWQALPELAGFDYQGAQALVELSQLLHRSWPRERRFVWVLDQFEELFSVGLDETLIEAFGQFLLALQADGIWTLACVRADALPQLKRHPQLRRVFGADEGQYYLETMSATALDDVINRPAAVAGLTFGRSAAGKSLDQVLREDAYRDRENALPLLQFALHELYQRRSGTELTFAAYDQLGGLSGSVATAAAAALQAESAELRAAVPRLFRTLIGLDEAGRPTRRYALLSDIAADTAQQQLLSRLVQARLCVTDQRDGMAVVVLAHEALLRTWPAVVEWLAQEEEFLHQRELAQRETRLWLENRESDAWLAPADKLVVMQPLVAAGIDLAPDVRRFLERSGQRARRNARIRQTAIGTIILLAVAASIAGWIATNQQREAWMERNAALRAESTADRTSRFMVSLFKLADPGENRGNSVTVREVLDRGAGELGRGLQREPQVRADLLTAMGQAYTGLGLYGPARKLLSQALEDQDAVAVAPESRVRTLVATGSVLDAADELGDAQQKLERALDIAGKQLPPDSVLISDARDVLADVLIQLGQFPEAERLCEAALAVDRERRGPDRAETLSQTLDTLAQALSGEGRLAEAEPPTREALALRREYFGNRHALTAQSMNNLAALLYQAGRYEEAASQWQEALPVYREVYGTEHPELATLLNNLGRSALMAGRVKEAIPLLENALQMGEHLWGPDHDYLVLPLNSLGMAYLYEGDANRAGADISRALQLARPRSHTILDQVVLNAADLELSRRRAGGSLPLLSEARQLLEKRYPPRVDSTEQWRYAEWEAVNAARLALENHRDLAQPALAHARDVLVKRFGPGGFYVLRLDQRAAAVGEAAARQRH
jgi:tetratricopeptide (TPR) repeat protein